MPVNMQDICLVSSDSVKSSASNDIDKAIKRAVSSRVNWRSREARRTKQASLIRQVRQIRRIRQSRLTRQVGQPRESGSSTLFCKLVCWGKNERGSATLESMLVFPLILFVIVIMLLVAVYGYQQVYVQYISLTAAERASYNWDGRERSIRTAQPQSSNYYGLYEHELSAVLLKNFIALADHVRQQQVDIARDSTAATPVGKLLEDRLAQAKSYIIATNSGVEGSIALSRKGFIPAITVQLQRDISPLFWQQQMLLPAPAYTSHYDIYAATQFIRNVDLFLYYFKKYSDLTHEQKQARKNNGGKALKTFSSP